ncbi:MAG: hypothetical protein AABY54_00200 [Deltaproteobacteria bacterium]
MRAGRGTLIILIFLIASYALIFPSFEKARKDIRLGEVKGFNLPPLVVKFMAFEFKSIAADLHYVRASQFYGGRVDRLAEATRDDWAWLYTNLWLATELDPYFQDPYYLGNAFLTWDAGLYVQANKLLQKGMDARTWDWTLPFYIGFNKFYFLNENKEAADYLLKAYERPGAIPYLPNLAARLYQREGRTEAALAFLVNFWENERDQKQKKAYEIRIDAFRKILSLEKAAALYKERNGKQPEKLEELVKAGLIKEIPQDPYGGTFYIRGDGVIETTSKLANVAPKK